MNQALRAACATDRTGLPASLADSAGATDRSENAITNEFLKAVVSIAGQLPRRHSEMRDQRGNASATARVT